jgi:hypothetical protein
MSEHNQQKQSIAFPNPQGQVEGHHFEKQQIKESACYRLQVSNPQVQIMSNIKITQSLIAPETGVTVIENLNKKGGQKDYFHKYHKFSKNDYYNMMVNISNL